MTLLKYDKVLLTMTLLKYDKILLGYTITDIFFFPCCFFLKTLIISRGKKIQKPSLTVAFASLL